MNAFIKNRKRQFLAAITALALLLAVVRLWMPVSEKEDPIIEGRRLSSWLEVYPHTGAQPIVPTPDGLKRSSPEEREDFYRTAFGEEVAEAHRVLLAAGGDAFPLLIRVLSERETRLQRCRNDREGREGKGQSGELTIFKTSIGCVMVGLAPPIKQVLVASITLRSSRLPRCRRDFPQIIRRSFSLNSMFPRTQASAGTVRKARREVLWPATQHSRTDPNHYD